MTSILDDIARCAHDADPVSCRMCYADSSGVYAARDADEPTRVSEGLGASTGRLILTPASSIRPKPVTWAWNRVLPAGELALAVGRGGTGKSSFAVWLAAQVTRGTLDGHLRGRPANVAIVAVEDSWECTIVPRLHAADADCDRVFHLGVRRADVGTAELSLPNDWVELEAAITEYSIGLVILDPLISVMDGKLNANQNADVRRALQPLADIAHRTGTLFLGVCHFNKSSIDPTEAVAGAKAFVDLSRAYLAFARDDEHTDEDGTHVMTLAKANLGPTGYSQRYRLEETLVPTDYGRPAESSRWVPMGLTERTVGDVLGGGEDGGDEATSAARWVEAYLADRGGQAEAGEVLKVGKSAGFSERTLKRARRKVATTDKSGFGSSWVWRLKSDIPAASGPPRPVRSDVEWAISEPPAWVDTESVPDYLPGDWS